MSSAASTSGASDPESSPNPTRIQQQLKRKRRDPVDHSDSESDDDSDAEPNDSVEAPALSHAERRRQKKKEERERKKSTSDSASAAKKRKLQDGVVSKKEKRQNSVWVGNLSFKTTTDALRGFFDGVGEITRVHMPMKAGAKGDNMGLVTTCHFYFIKF